jgi:photosystem II stability/assembly factor-like uncharacterized protein
MSLAPRLELAASALALCLLLAVPLAAAPKRAGQPEGPAVDPALFGSLEWRELGPYRGGRSAAVAGIRGDRSTYYFGATGGGVWKSTDAGRSWNNVSDGTFGGSIGAVAVAPSDPNVVYVGTGEKTVRGNVSSGDGVWKSTDAGKSWKHAGLADTRQIPRVRVHPTNPDLVWVCALGHLFGPNEERGVFRSSDGGASWRRVKFVSPDAGCVDLALDPANPRVLYATFWNVRRRPWTLASGGPGSGIWKSTDGGDSWRELTAKPGLPRGTLGIVGVAVSPAAPEQVWAMVEAEDGGLFRSRDGGESWTRTSDDRSLRQRAWYYTRVVADPADADTVYVLNVRLQRSKDGGKSFTGIRVPHGDNHDLWIDPDDPRRMIEANDGGANVSEDGGESWTPQSNQPTAQIYRVSTDDAFPWRVLGGQQDNSALRLRTRSAFGDAIGFRDWEETAGGESGHVVAAPGEPDVVFGGSYHGFLMRADHRTGEVRNVQVWPDDPMGGGAIDATWRFQWNFPLFFSPHEERTLYAAANVLFRSRDEGQTWQRISPDLTRNDPSKLGPSGGPITKDNTGVEYYGTIFAAAESPLEPGLLWTASDDGLVHLTRDGGANWTNVTPPALPEWSQVNSIEVDPFAKGGLYLAATRYKLDDDQPLLFRTADYGATWTRIDAGIARSEFTRVIRADPAQRGLLYAGTERGIWISFDDGARWQRLPHLVPRAAAEAAGASAASGGPGGPPSRPIAGLPQVPVTDLAVKDGTLVAATQGRGFWALDDLELLRALAPGDRADAHRLFAPRPAIRVGGSRDEAPRHAGTNPPHGVVFHYLLAEEPPSEVEVRLDLFGAGEEPLRSFTRRPKREGPESDKKREDERGEDLRRLPTEKGANRFVWDLDLAPPERFEGLVLWNRIETGPAVPPGRYRAKLAVGDWSAEVPFEVVPDPRVAAGAEELAAQFGFLVGIRDRLSEVHRRLRAVRDLRGQLETLEQRAAAVADAEAGRALAERSKRLREAMTAIEERLYQTRNKSEQDPLNFPLRLNDKLAGVYQAAALGWNRPTAAQLAVRDELTAKIDAELAALAQLRAEELPAISEAARALALPYVAETPKKEAPKPSEAQRAPV